MFSCPDYRLMQVVVVSWFCMVLLWWRLWSGDLLRCLVVVLADDPYLLFKPVL